MTIRSFQFDPAVLEALLSVRSELYRRDPHWIAPNERSVRAQLDPGFGFYRRAGNAHRHFVAEAGGAAVGHVSAFVNRELRDRDGAQVGAIGFFECIEEYSVAAELLHAAIEWLRAASPSCRVWGPINFDIWHGYRMMTKGFDAAPFFGEPYNKRYYPDYFERFGFAVREQWVSIEIDGRADLKIGLERLERHHRRSVEQGYRFRTIDPKDPGDLRRLHDVETRSYGHFVGYTPFDYGEFERLMAGYLRIVDPRFVTLIDDGEGRSVGFSVAYRDVGEAVRAMAGKDDLRARFRYLVRRRRADRVVYYMMGTVPEERLGLGIATLAHTIARVLDAGHRSMIFALVAARRQLTLFDGEALKARREYALFELSP